VVVVVRRRPRWGFTLERGAMRLAPGFGARASHEPRTPPADGGYHERRAAADARRERNLRALGYRILRLEAELAERDVAAAVERVREALGERR
jgi:hypothetical protein